MSSTVKSVKANHLWAKTNKSRPDQFHPLLFHMLDVAAVAINVWDGGLPMAIRARLEASLPEGNSTAFLGFIAGAHDVGKACPAFQKLVPELGDQSGLLFSKNDNPRPHGFVSAVAIHEFLGPSPAATLLGQVVGGHHGVFPRSCDMQMGVDVLGSTEWKNARHSLLNELARIVGVDEDAVRKACVEVDDPFSVPVLAGFISVVDWVASNQDFFPCVAEVGRQLSTTPDDYWKRAQEQAKQALEALGWLPKVTFRPEAKFCEVFRGYSANPLQEKVFELAGVQSSPYLMFVEAPMGHGKTEAALYAADLALCRGFARGMYVAMPTQATSNAMFNRVLDDYLGKRGHTGKLNVQLVHGNALLADLANASEEAKIGEIKEFDPDSVQDDASGDDITITDVEAQSWFTARKRPLLAPFGVGTIDQSLLSVLNTKHWFVRMFGLAGKVVIFDEVHAYDAYMSTILERLLHWLAELDCTVILLSATLPDARRKSLAGAYSGRDDAEYKRYPRITLAKPRHFIEEQAPEQPTCMEVPMGDSRAVKLTVAGTEVTALAETLAEKLRDGGCAAIICNTVDRSIEVFQYLQGNLQKTECLLFHARTLQRWRREQEEEVLAKFGKEGKRPKRAVLVATQVVEQSLDLDFDLMVSEIAPVDLLLQRSGRLHRHTRTRPVGLEQPELIVLCDGQATGQPPETFGNNTEHVYDRYVLLRTWLALRGRDQIEVPGEIEELIEFVYSKEDLPKDDGWSEALNQAKTKMDFERSESEKNACRLLISKPKDPGDLIEEFNDRLADDEDPEVHASVRATTREGEPSITVVMLPKGETLTSEPKILEVRTLLDHSVKISKRGLFHELLNQGEQPREWAKNAHLRHSRCVRLNDQNQGQVGDYALTVDEKLGVVITKSGGSNGRV